MTVDFLYFVVDFLQLAEEAQYENHVPSDCPKVGRRVDTCHDGCSARRRRASTCVNEVIE